MIVTVPASRSADTQAGTALVDAGDARVVAMGSVSLTMGAMTAVWPVTTWTWSVLAIGGLSLPWVSTRSTVTSPEASSDRRSPAP